MKKIESVHKGRGDSSLTLNSGITAIINDLFILVDIISHAYSNRKEFSAKGPSYRKTPKSTSWYWHNLQKLEKQVSMLLNIERAFLIKTISDLDCL